MKLLAYFGIGIGLLGITAVPTTICCNPLWFEFLLGCLSMILVVNGILLLREKKEKMHEK